MSFDNIFQLLQLFLVEIPLIIAVLLFAIFGINYLFTNKDKKE